MKAIVKIIYAGEKIKPYVYNNSTLSKMCIVLELKIQVSMIFRNVDITGFE